MILTNNELKSSFLKIFKNRPDKYKYYILDNFKLTKEHVNKYFSDDDRFKILNHE